MQSSLDAYTSIASHVIGDCFDIAKPYLDNNYSGLPSLARFISAQLFIDCNLSSESVLLLIRAQKEWDADLINRAVMEGSLKFSYLLQGTQEKIEEKANEYWNILPLFYGIRHSENVKKFFEYSDVNSSEWRTLKDLTMEKADIDSVREKYSRVDRQTLEERWSFAGLCKTFASSENPGLRAFSGLSHGYTMSSHLLHKDADGIGMVWERYTRTQERQHAVKMGHSVRIISDICSFAKLRLFSLLQACSAPIESLNELNEKYQPFEQSIAAVIEKFNIVEYGSER